MKKIILSFLLLAVFGCSNFTDLRPRNNVPTEFAFVELEDFELAMNGIYTVFRRGAMYGINVSVLGDILSDHIALGPTNSGAYLKIYRWTYSSGDGEFAGVWYGSYAVIAFANTLLKEFDAKFPVLLECDRRSTQSLQGSRKARAIKAQAHLARAVAYYNLLRFFCAPLRDIDKYDQPRSGVPVVFEAVASEPARNTIREVLTQIEADINESLQLFNSNCVDDTYGTGEFKASRLNKYAAYALRARIAYEQRRWNDAITNVNLVYGAGSIIGLPDQKINDLWGTYEHPEIIWKIRNTANDVPLNRIAWVYVGPNDGLDFVPSSRIISFFSGDENQDDIRREQYFTTKDVPGRGPTTAMNKIREREGAGERGVADNIVFRGSEMILIRAEANFNLGNEGAALADLNIIRTARNLPALDGVSGNQLRNAIALERQKELFAEGHRFFDIKNNGESIIRASGEELDASSFRFIFPIPAGEFNANKNMTQNPGY